MVNKILVSILVVFMIPHFGWSQRASGSKPEIGKPMPEFSLENITHYKRTKASLKDFKGKWLFLDFWFTGCMACIQNFQKVNSYHKKFQDRANWIMVGLTDSESNAGTQQFYEKLSAKQNLEMPSAYDSILVNRWEITSMPHIIMVDPSGIVHSITSGRDMTMEKIQALLDGKKVTFFQKDKDRSDFNPDAEMTRDKLLYRSLLTKWGGELQYGGYDIDRYVTDKIYRIEDFNLAMVPLYAIYNYAYVGRWNWDYANPDLYGKVYPKPILLLKDSSLFQYDFNIDVGKGTFNYSLSIPKETITRERIMQFIQEDLKRTFNYTVSVEYRKMRVWRLVAEPGATEKLKTKGGDRFATPGTHALGYTLRNWPKEYLIGSISFYILEKYKVPFVDDTGMTDNIDFSIQADMTNLEDIRINIKKQGLDLVMGTREMKVIVIRDSQ